jgi:hypothetical protein
MRKERITMKTPKSELNDQIISSELSEVALDYMVEHMKLIYEIENGDILNIEDQTKKKLHLVS